MLLSVKNKRSFINTLLFTTACSLATLMSVAKANDSSEWIQLFNGKDLNDWQVKFVNRELGDNYLDTFQVKNGLLNVSYDKHKSFDNMFGHLYYKTPYSHYILRAEYRFIGSQVAGGPAWAKRNNGLMLHAQDPKSMKLDQDFPVSIEVQLLGGLGKGKRTTLNMCSPDTHVVYQGKLDKRHCIKSTSRTYHGNQWVTVEVEVHGSDKFIHRINGETVMEYTNTQYDDKKAQDFIKQTGSHLLNKGFIAIQAESHPTQFRKIELKVLDEN